MSLVPATGGEWQVVLRNPDTQAAVLFDPYTHRFALLNEYNDDSISTRTSSHHRCSQCGSLLSEDQASAYYSGRNEHSSSTAPGHRRASSTGPLRAIGSPALPSHDMHPSNHETQLSGEPTRDPNYFRLLEYFNSHRNALPPSSDLFPSAPGSPRFNVISEPGTPSSPPMSPSTPTGTASPPIAHTDGISEAAFSQGYFDRFFVSQALLGRGSRGAVYKVEHLLDGVSLGTFALKKVAVGDNHDWLEKVLSEVNLLRMLAHPNLVRYNHVWLETSSLSTFGPTVPCAYILQEFCDGGTLEEYMEAHSHHRQELFSDNNKSQETTTTTTTSTKESARLKREKTRLRMNQASEPRLETDDDIVQLTVEEIVSYMHDITSGVLYLHDNQIVHRDLKPSNCLLVKVSSQNTSAPSENPVMHTSRKFPRVLVSDFGEGQLEGRRRTGTGSTGTLEYCAPELLRVGPNGEELGQFSKKTDIFSLGMILHYLCYSRLPYSNVWQEKGDLEALTEEVRRFPGFSETLSNSKFHRTDLGPLVDLIDSMLSLDPNNRPDARQTLYVIEQFGQSLKPSTASSRVKFASPSNVLNEVKLLMAPNTASASGLWNPMLWVRNFSENNQYLAIKLALIACKFATLYKFETNQQVTSLLILLFGIELPLQSPQWSIALFISHCIILAISVFMV